jgi:hypothetical protein
MRTEWLSKNSNILIFRRTKVRSDPNQRQDEIQNTYIPWRKYVRKLPEV